MGRMNHCNTGLKTNSSCNFHRIHNLIDALAFNSIDFSNNTAMNALPRNIILKELENVGDHHLADLLNYIQFLKATPHPETQSISTAANELENTSNVYPTLNLNKPDYIIVTNHLN
jgi:hypothetical protein